MFISPAGAMSRRCRFNRRSPGEGLAVAISDAAAAMPLMASRYVRRGNYHADHRLPLIKT